MLKRGNVLSPEFTTAVQQVVRQHLTSFQPRPRSARKRRGGGGAEATSTIRFARAYTTITAASDNLTANWGSGQIKYMDDTSGVLDLDPVEVDNPLIGVTFAVDSQVLVDTGTTPPKVINGTCAAVTWVPNP